MRVLFVGAHLDKGGGQALQTLQLFRELRKSVEGEYLVLRAGGPHVELLQEEGVRVVGKLRMPGGVFDLRSAIRDRRGDWDVLQLFDVYYALPAAYSAAAYPRTVLYGTNPVTEIGWRYNRGAQVAARLGLEILMEDTRLVVNSPTLAAEFHRFHPVFIPNGLDFRRFESLPTRAEARAALGIPVEERLLLWIGKVVYSKRVDWLFESLRSITDLRLVAVGGYDEEHFGDRYLRQLRSQYSDVVARSTFTGEVPYARIGTYLAAADVFGFPSRYEGMPNAVMEAMAAGLPVVASDIPAHRALVRDGETGYLARSPREFADRIARLLSDGSLRAGLARRAQEFARSEFTFDRVSHRHLELYREMVKRS